ncbi:MAG: dCMP deaminase family protein [Muribaculaceae bacterium]|nr:dCMP deaminase family protein [Muribaculaceae bacterium]
MTNKDKLYLRMAFEWAKNSYAIRRKVGCIIVKDSMIISDGYNGTPSGFPNVCEYATFGNQRREPSATEELKLLQAQGWTLVTYPYVLHAESNAITKLARHGNSSRGATLYVTDEPCLECSKLIIQSGIERVVYCRPYHTHDGIDLLKTADVEIECITEILLKQ